MENLRVTDRTVMNYIKELMKSGLITKAKKGFYEKGKVRKQDRQLKHKPTCFSIHLFQFFS